MYLQTNIIVFIFVQLRNGLQINYCKYITIIMQAVIREKKIQINNTKQVEK